MRRSRLVPLVVIASAVSGVAGLSNGCGDGVDRNASASSSSSATGGGHPGASAGSGGDAGADGTAPPGDASMPDGSMPDGSMPDGSMPDGSAPVDAGVDVPRLHTAVFTDSIGVGVHMGANQNQQAYIDPTAVAHALSWLPITHVRDSIGGASGSWKNTYASSGPFAAAGIHFDVGFGSGKTTNVAGTLSPYFSAPDGGTPFLDTPLALEFIESLEGPNEVDNPGSPPPGYDGGVALQESLWAAAQADPLLKSKPVLALTVAFPANSQNLGDLHGYATYGNLHAYPDNVPPRATIDSYLAATVDTPGLPMIVTEIGYFTRTPAFTYTPRAVAEDVQAKWLLDAIFDTYSAGVLRTYLYDLIDDGPYMNSGQWLVDEEQHYGLFRWPLSDPPDASAKPLAVALKNVMTILTDPSPTPFVAVPLPFTVTSGADASTGPFSLLLEKSAGVYELVLWVEPNLWDNTNGVEIPATATSVTVTLPSKYDANVYDPLVGTTPASTMMGMTTFDVSVVDHPIIVELTASP